MDFYTCKNDKCFKCLFLNPLNQDLLTLMIKESTDLDFKNIVYLNIEKNVNMYVRRKYLDLYLDSNQAIVVLRLMDLIENMLGLGILLLCAIVILITH